MAPVTAAMTDMPSTYETTTTSTSSNRGIGPDPTYIRTIPGMLKIAECVVTILAFICAIIKFWAHLGGGWVQFVSISAFIFSLLLFLFHFMRLISRLPGPWMLIEFCYYCVYTVLLFIAGIVAAVRASQYLDTASVGAAAFFVFVAVVLYAVDAFFLYRTWQESRFTTTTQGTGAVTSSTTTTVTSSTHVIETY